VLTEVAATVAQLLSRGGNRVGALFFDGRVRETIPPGNGRNHVLRILARMLAAPQSAEPGPTDLGVALRAAAGDPAAALARRARLGLHQRAGLAGPGEPARPPARRGGHPGGRPARVRAARGRDDLRRGRRDR
jgi:hypothetical protein